MRLRRQRPAQSRQGVSDAAPLRRARPHARARRQGGVPGYSEVLTMRMPLHTLISQQAMKIAVDCDRAAIRDALVSARWDSANFWLGLSSAITAAVAAFAVSNGADLLAGGAVVYHQFSNKYHALRDRIRSFVGIHCVDEASADELIREFKALLDEKRSIDADHPVVPERYYRAAAAKMKEKIKRNQRIQELEAALERPSGR